MQPRALSVTMSALTGQVRKRRRLAEADSAHVEIYMGLSCGYPSTAFIGRSGPGALLLAVLSVGVRLCTMLQVQNDHTLLTVPPPSHTLLC